MPPKRRKVSGDEAQYLPWAVDVDAVLLSHNVNVTNGLSSAQVAELTAKHGPNELDKEEATPLWKVYE